MDENQKTLLKAQTDVQIAIATSLSLLAIALTLVLVIWQISRASLNIMLPLSSSSALDFGSVIVCVLVGAFFVTGIGAGYFAWKARQHRKIMN